MEKFVSWFPELGCFRSDAFSFSWENFISYSFPPFNLISKVLNKIGQDRVSKSILILPHWPSQAWFPVLLSMLISYPVRSPRHKDSSTRWSKSSSGKKLVPGRTSCIRYFLKNKGLRETVINPYIFILA